MKRLPIVLVMVYPAISRAETAIKFPDCTKVDHAVTSQCWDFEDGTLDDAGFGAWTATGTAFATQPTFGDNVMASRILTKQPSAMRATGTMLDDLRDLGGDFWETPYPIGHQGQFWIGTFENRPDERAAWSAVQGDSPMGTITSPSFVIDQQYVTFLVGGTCDALTEKVEVQLEVSGFWVPFIDVAGASMVTGTCSELMERKVIPMYALQGRTARIVVTDDSPNGHINVDDVRHTSVYPMDGGGANRPLWGFADTHAHPGNHQSFQALNGGGHLLDGVPDHPDSVMRGRCDGGDHGQRNHVGGRTASFTADTTSLGSAPAMPEGCDGLSCFYKQQSPTFNAPGNTLLDHAHHDPNVGAPYWYTRTHQQMYLDWIKRSYQGGQRLLVATAGNNELLGSVLRDGHRDPQVSDYGAVRRFAAYMKWLVANPNNSWMEIAYTPADARRIIRGNRLAIILSTEVEDIGDHCKGDISWPYPDQDGGQTTTMSTNGANPWNQIKVRTSCGNNTNDWVNRVESLYAAGYRMIIPMHFSNNDLGGPAVYTDLHNMNNRFMNGAFLSVMSSPDVEFRLGESARKHDEMSVKNFHTPPNPLAAWNIGEIGWCQTNFVGGCVAGGGMGWLVFLPTVEVVLSILTQATYTPIPIAALSPLPKYDPSNPRGHVNTVGLTPQGRAVLQAMMDRGMLIDVAHMSDLGRNALLGLGGTTNSNSIVNPGCDLTKPSCQDSAYPVISSHAGLRQLQRVRDEGGIDGEMIERIHAIGGTVAVGTAGGDPLAPDMSMGPDDPSTGRPWTGILATTVMDDCAGSSKTFAQGYLYALRMTMGKGITLGTDLNGFEAQLNPRFGTMGCYARGTIPRIVQFAHDGTTLIDAQSVVPYKYDSENIFMPFGTAGAQRVEQRDHSDGINYTHYRGRPPVGGPGPGLKFFNLVDPSAFVPYMQQQQWGKPLPATLDPISMKSLARSPSLMALTSMAGRTFDFNYDGLANYGLLPDLLQDTRADGLTNEQLGPLFQGAEALVEAWEKSCRLSNSKLSKTGCHP